VADGPGRERGREIFVIEVNINPQLTKISCDESSRTKRRGDRVVTYRACCATSVFYCLLITNNEIGLEAARQANGDKFQPFSLCKTINCLGVIVMDAEEGVNYSCQRLRHAKDRNAI
jgi:hypothetical protein